MKSAAMDYLSRGWAVFPCYPRSKFPATEHGLRDAVVDRAGVHRLWTRKGFNLAVATGAASGIFVVDVDGPEGAASLHALESRYQPLPKTLTAVTGKGSHLYFEHPGTGVRPSVGKVGPGIDIRGDGSSAILPPSIHANGRRYAWLDEATPIAAAPAWMVDAVTRVSQRPVASFEPRRQTHGWALREVGRMLDRLSPDMAYDEWVRVGMALHAGGYPFEVWDEWSRGSAEKYDQRASQAAWRGFREGGVSMGTLIYMANRAGSPPSV